MRGKVNNQIAKYKKQRDLLLALRNRSPDDEARLSLLNEVIEILEELRR
jgi:hypothetical protein